MFAILAILCFLLAVFGANIAINLVALGLAFLAAHALLGWWPLSGPPWSARSSG
ncbi:MAG: hypothetical protein ACRDS1_04185 [Pseudonocardiaceae bacterium]